MDELLKLDPEALTRAGQAANQVAAQYLFTAYLDRLAPNSRKRQRAALTLFALPGGGRRPLAIKALIKDPTTRAGVTWGLVAGFLRYLLAEGYAIGTINFTCAHICINMVLYDSSRSFDWKLNLW